MAAPAENGSRSAVHGLAGVGRDAEFVVRYRAEIERRLAAGGVGSIPEAFAMLDRLRRAIDGISGSELQWTRSRVDAVIAQVEAHAAELATVRQLKRRIGG